jgi:hypothetical protein
MIDSFPHNNFTIEIHTDSTIESPRTWDNLATLVCFHRRYNLGDTDDGYHSEEFSGWDDVLKQIENDHQLAAIVPLYLFDHSGLCISTDPERFRVFDPQG